MRKTTVLAVALALAASGQAVVAQTTQTPEPAANPAANDTAQTAPPASSAAGEATAQPVAPTGTATSAADERAVTEAPLKPSLTAEELTARLNASDICTPLTLNVNDITSLFGIAIPSFLPIDPNLRWNQNAHRVTDFVQNEGSFEATINFGCQPNSNGAILDFVGLSADRLRVPGEAFCAGALDEAGGFIGTDCTIEGRITPYIGKAIDLEGRLERAMGSSVAPDGAAPSQTSETSGG